MPRRARSDALDALHHIAQALEIRNLFPGKGLFLTGEDRVIVKDRIRVQVVARGLDRLRPKHSVGNG